MIKVSILTICLNDREGLRKTIRSIAEQTFRDFEFIVIDGGSTDGSAALLQENKSVITHSISEKDDGIYHAQNKAIRLATGEYCLFLNSGDYLAGKDVLERVFKNTIDSDILYGNMMIEDQPGKLRLGKMPAELSFHHMIADTLWHPVSFIRRSLFAKFGMYDESLSMVADYEFFFKTIIVHQVHTHYLDFPVSVFNLNGFSSDPKNLLLRETERRAVQLRYFPASVIETAHAYNRIRNSRWYKLAVLLRMV